MKTGLAIATLGLLLAGCGGGSPPTGNTAATAVAADPIEARIAALSEVQRKTAFFKAIYDADFQCDEIVNIADRPRDHDHRAWLATCSDTGDYYITLQQDGVLTVSGVSQPKTRLPKGTKILPLGTK